MKFRFLALILIPVFLAVSCTRNSTSGSETSSAQKVQDEATPSTAAPPVTTQPQMPQPEAMAPEVAQPPDEEATYRIPPYFEDPDAAAPLAATLDPRTVIPAAQYAYTLAQKNPRLLTQLPCFCYCDRFGHKSLHDCFADKHAEGCEVCLNEAVEANQMNGQGMSPKEIRSVIIAKYHPRS